MSDRPTSVLQVNTASKFSTGVGVLVTYPTGPHRPIGPLQYRPIGIRPELPDGQSATVAEPVISDPIVKNTYMYN